MGVPVLTWNALIAGALPLIMTIKTLEARWQFHSLTKQQNPVTANQSPPFNFTSPYGVFCTLRTSVKSLFEGLERYLTFSKV